MKKVVRTFVFVLFCLTLFNCLPGAYAGVSPRPGPINYYDPCTSATKAFFPSGWYAHHDSCDDYTDDVYAAGGNTLAAAFGNDTPSFDDLIPVLNLAQLRGKKVIVVLVTPDFFIGVNPNDPNTYTALAQFVNAAKNHPALLGWLLGDENEWNFPGSSADIVNSAYVINNILDGNHQIWQVFSGFDGVRQLPYLNGTTVYSTDLYPNHADDEPNSFLDMENYLTGAYLMGQKAVENNVAAALITQGFGFDNAPPDWNINGVWRLPTHREYRWNIFSAIAAAGSRGTLNWLYEPAWYTDPFVFYDWRDYTAMPVFDEQEMVAHGMETGYNAGTVDANWTSKASDNSGGWVRNYDRITQLLVYDNSLVKYFLIVTNNGPTSQNMNFTLSNLPQPLADANVLVYDGADSNEIITLTNLGGGSYRLDDTLQGFDVLIYRLNAVKSVFFIGDNGNNWDTSGKITTGASSGLYGRQPINTISGGGISENGLTHNTGVFDYPPPVGNAGMWLSAGGVDGTGVISGWGTHYIAYIFDKSYSLDEMWLWNYNESGEWWDGPSCGMKSVKIVADTGTGWATGTTLFTGVIPKATGTGINPVNLAVNCGGVSARGVIIFSALGSEHNWSNGAVENDGLSEIRFYYKPACDEAIASGLGMASDLNGDCYVNFADLDILAQNWLQCVDTQAVSCE